MSCLLHHGESYQRNQFEHYRDICDTWLVGIMIHTITSTTRKETIWPHYLETALQRCTSAIFGKVAKRALKATMIAVAKWCRVEAVMEVICVGGPHRTDSVSQISRRCSEPAVKEAGARLSGCKMGCVVVNLSEYRTIQNSKNRMISKSVIQDTAN